MARSWLRAPSEITILNLPASILLTKGESSIYIIEGNEKKGVIEKLFVSSYKTKAVIKNSQNKEMKSGSGWNRTADRRLMSPSHQHKILNKFSVTELSDTMTIKDLGKWESLEMVQRYTSSMNIQDSMKF